MSFDDLRDLYQDIILDHGRHPRHARKLAVFDATAKGDNPMCGDRVQLWLKYAPDRSIAEAAFEARGCAISIASADLMAEVVKGRSPEGAKALFALFRDMVRTGDCPSCTGPFGEALDRLKPLSGVHEYPSRVKCATLAWHALNAALDSPPGTVMEASSE